MTDETHDEWHAKLTEKEKRWVAVMTEVLAGRCDDPLALVRADMASPEYALVARQLALHNYGPLPHGRHHCSLRLLRSFAGAMRHQHSAAAVALIDRVASSGLTEDEILTFADFMMHATETWVRSNVDTPWDQLSPLVVPQYVMMEVVEDTLGGRKVSGGSRFGASGDQIDPWPGNEPGVRPWHSARLDDARLSP